MSSFLIRRWVCDACARTLDVHAWGSAAPAPVVPAGWTVRRGGVDAFCETCAEHAHTRKEHNYV